ncbi:uncharacterized protein RCC_09401 [Ramularia collo-cygni]|uniref:Wax synthase domain-containing protein n=1 Tax=Ramularia collo-cygni TaxID=112498 RepID=A0A2D3V049_9PEZI|nr:uncharacterized protein RCC_09401 [Ramularia collo-cygni]CZT23687.1 uncharacterized protein RCC_09401 [Ramularia collo-cygni]
MTDQEAILLRPTRGSSLPHILLVIAQLFFLTSSPFRGRRELAIGTLTFLAIWAGISPWTHDPGAANFAALAWPHWLSTIEKFLNSMPSPEVAVWPVDKAAGIAVTYNAFGWQKLKWAVSLILNLRGIRYNTQVKNVPPARFTSKQQHGKVKFLLWQAVELAYCMFMGDLVAQLSIALFFTPAPTNSMLLNAYDADWRLSFLKALVFGSGPYFFINMQYVLASMVCVAIGVSKPEDWPPLFGRLRTATTVRAFWGKFWHQMIRRPLTGLTDRILAMLRIPHGTTASSYASLWLAFAISGFMHAASLTLMPCPADVEEWARWRGLLAHFMWQAAAITFEDFVIYIWRRKVGSSAPPAAARVIGYVWVIWSFWTSLPMAADVLLKLRMGAESPFPVTFWGPFVQKFVHAGG